MYLFKSLNLFGHLWKAYESQFIDQGSKMLALVLLTYGLCYSSGKKEFD